MGVDPPMAVSPLLLTPKQAAAALAISARALWSLTKCGDVPSVRIGRSVRYRIESLQAWLAEREGGAM